MARPARLARAAVLTGTGLHSGVKDCSVRVSSLPQGSGVVFETEQGVRIKATVDAVQSTAYSTTLMAPRKPDIRVSTVEHLLAAMSACRLDDALVEVTGPEIPILDGSSNSFIRAFERSGLSSTSTYSESPNSVGSCRRYIEVKRPVHVCASDTRSEAWLLPKSCCSSTEIGSVSLLSNRIQMLDKERISGFSNTYGLSLSAVVDFSERGLQKCSVETCIDMFAEDIAPARTFTFEQDIEELWSSGLAKGGSMECALFFDKFGRPVNPEGMRFPDEWARHKLLDCIGDLALAGYPLHGHYHGIRPGHTMNVALVKELMSCADNYVLATVSL